jgi:hypothetical protein
LERPTLLAIAKPPSSASQRSLRFPVSFQK